MRSLHHHEARLLRIGHVLVIVVTKVRTEAELRAQGESAECFGSADDQACLQYVIAAAAHDPDADAVRAPQIELHAHDGSFVIATHHAEREIALLRSMKPCVTAGREWRFL